MEICHKSDAFSFKYLNSHPFLRNESHKSSTETFFSVKVGSNPLEDHFHLLTLHYLKGFRNHFLALTELPTSSLLFSQISQRDFWFSKDNFYQRLVLIFTRDPYFYCLTFHCFYFVRRRESTQQSARLDSFSADANLRTQKKKTSPWPWI